MEDLSRENLIRSRIQAIGEDVFPEDAVAWKVNAMRHHGVFSVVEAEAIPATVGYPKFLFVLHAGEPGQAVFCAAYCWSGDHWSLLCSENGAPDGWRQIPVNA